MDTQLLEKTFYKAVGADPKHVEALFKQVQTMDGGLIRYEHFQRYGEDIITLIYDRNIDQRILLGVMQTFSEGLQDCLYSVDESTLPQQVIGLLKERGLRISVAESFTGGGVASALTSVSGASAVYFEGLNTYNEESKIKRLGVRRETLQKYGAASKEVAGEMAEGLLQTGDCDIAISTTGIAGPKSDDSGFPVGLCFIGIGRKDGITVYRYMLDGDRTAITQTAVKYALFLAYKWLKNI